MFVSGWFAVGVVGWLAGLIRKSENVSHLVLELAVVLVAYVLFLVSFILAHHVLEELLVEVLLLPVSKLLVSVHLCLALFLLLGVDVELVKYAVEVYGLVGSKVSGSVDSGGVVRSRCVGGRGKGEMPYGVGGCA